MGWGGRWEDGSGWGTHVHPWMIHVNVWQKPPQYCKVISFQLKFFKNKNKFKNCTSGREMGKGFIKEGIYVYIWLIHVEV